MIFVNLIGESLGVDLAFFLFPSQKQERKFFSVNPLKAKHFSSNPETKLLFTMAYDVHEVLV